MLKRDVAVIEAAETLVQKWREFDNNGQGEDPEDYAEALMRAVSARKEDLKPTTTETLTPSITVGTQVRLTGVVVNVDIQGYVDIHLDGDGGGETSITPEAAKYIEVIRQPFKRGEVVYLASQAASDAPCVVVSDEKRGEMLMAAAQEDCTVLRVEAKYYERRP